ncbi:MAG: hypothetical protein ACRD02_07790 [Acidimicrobiia bacterium]
MAGAVALCCGTTLLVALGVGWLAAVLVSPWFLVPAAAALGAWAWYRRRRRCRVPEPRNPAAGRRAGGVG